MTFAEAAEKVRNGDCGHSQVAITDLGKVPAERLHPKAADSRCRPGAAGGYSTKLPFVGHSEAEILRPNIATVIRSCERRAERGECPAEFGIG